MSVLIVLIAISFCTATSLILVNKKVMNNYGFECPTFLTSYHFVLSAILLNLMVKFKFIKPNNNIPTLYQWSTAAFGVGSIVFLNLNLKVNSIGFYQLSKLCNIPMMVVYKLVFKKMKTPKESLFSLAILLTGLCLFTVNDVQFNVFGTVIAFIAISSTTVFQSRSSYMQTEYSITGPQLNQVIAFPEFVICIISALLMETHGKKSIFVHEFQTVEIGLILLTGVFAVYGNIIGFIMIGKTGPVTFQVIGHVKTILIFVFGLIMFPPTQYESPEQKTKKIIGLVISMVGVIMYTYFELKIKENEKKEKLLSGENTIEKRRSDEEGILEHRDKDTMFPDTDKDSENKNSDDEENEGDDQEKV